MTVNLDWFSKALEAIRNPMILNAVLSLVLLGVLWIAVDGGVLREPFVWAVFIAIVALTVWTNRFAAKNPHFLTYGPKEYIRESEMNHELNLRKDQSVRKAKSRS